MIKLYYSSNIDYVNWRIYVDNIDKNTFYFSNATTPTDVADKLCQCGLFDQPDNQTIYVVNIDDWKLSDKQTEKIISDLHSLPITINFAIESSSIKNKVFAKLGIETIKATSITKKAKALIIHKLLTNNKIKLSIDVENHLIDLLPDKIDFIKNEINKLGLLNQKTFTLQEIDNLVFDLGDATIFNIADSWLKGNEKETIERLNNLLSKNITIQAFIPIFILKLVQIKFFLMAKLSQWPSELITSKQGITFWQQKIYGDLKPYNTTLKQINSTLKKLYEFDINVKKQKNIPYTQLIKILFK